jgi:DNA-binding NarL/FixJ family response regulator
VRQASDTDGPGSALRPMIDQGAQLAFLTEDSGEAYPGDGARETPAWCPLQTATTPVHRNRTPPRIRLVAVPAHSASSDTSTNHSRRPVNGRVILAAPHGSDTNTSRLCQALSSCGYSTDCIAPLGRKQLAHAVRQGDADALVMHTDLLRDIALAELLQVRRQFPAVHWILAWQTPSPQWAELAIRFRARGCIDGEDLSSLQRAMDTVLSGELWFPRWLSQAMYFRLLSAMDAARLESTDRLSGDDGALTYREQQALDFMRQGLTNRQIAWRLQVSVNTVKKHLKHAFEKLGLRSRRQGLCRSWAALAGALAAMSEFLALDFC